MKSKLYELLKYIPLLICASFALIYLFNSDDISAEAIFNYTPKNTFLAACFIILIYAVKSMSVIFPLLIIHIAAGMIFTPVTAMIVNIIGTIVAFTIPYLYGKFLGHRTTDRLFKKHSDIAKLVDPKEYNSFVLSLILRTIYILPCDVISIFFGVTNSRFIPYLFGSLIGNIPTMVSETLIGANANDPSSPMFWISIASSVVFSIGSIAVYHVIKKKSKNKTLQQNQIGHK